MAVSTLSNAAHAQLKETLQMDEFLPSWPSHVLLKNHLIEFR